MGDGKSTFTAYVGDPPEYLDTGSFTVYQKLSKPLPGSPRISVTTTFSSDLLSGKDSVKRKVELDIGGSGKATIDLDTGEAEGQLKRGPFSVGITTDGDITVKGGLKVTDPNTNITQEVGARAEMNVPATARNFWIFGEYAQRVFLGLDNMIEDSLRSGSNPFSFPGRHCFLSDTIIDMWPLDPSIEPQADGSYDEAVVLLQVWGKPIKDIKVGDIVVAYDDKGRLSPQRVLRTMENSATHILDFWGTGTTPGHAYFCADGPNKGKHAPIMDILRLDGAIMHADGRMIRAGTGCVVGSMGDLMIHAAATTQKLNGSWTNPKLGKVRFGTRVILPDGRDMSFLEMAHEEGWNITDEGYMVGRIKSNDGTVQERVFHFPYTHGEYLPNPEDYILARSAVTLEEIYAAGEWEQIGTQMTAPSSMTDLETNHSNKSSQPGKPEPNIPPAFADHQDAPYDSKMMKT